MGKIKPQTEASAAGGTAAICGVCNANMTQTQGWAPGSQVFHCEGQFKAGAAHHHHAPTWGNCWKCGKPLGCARCSAHSLAEALCRSCGVWGSKEALVEQGLLGGNAIDDYPTGWHSDYFAVKAFRDRGLMRAAQ
jgi:hypothetical protein